MSSDASTCSEKRGVLDPEAVLLRHLDHMLEGLQIIGRDWRYLYVNEEVIRQCRVPREALLGRTMMEVFPGIDATQMFAVLRDCMRRRVPRSVENRFARPDGQPGWFELAVEPAEPGLLVRSVEVTERVGAERALKAHAEALERSNAALAQYAHVAAHDLRGPLRQIAAFVQLVGEELGGAAPPSVRRNVRRALTATARLGALVDDLLDYSTLGSRAGRFEEVDLRIALGEALECVEEVAGAERTTFEIGDLPRVVSQPTLARTLLSNLLANAIKFSSHVASPVVRVGYEQDAGRVLVFVEDDGAGVAPELRARIFELFQRGPATTDAPGRGIGLACCKRIMELHGGDIGVEAGAAGGARFWLAFPTRADRLPR